MVDEEDEDGNNYLAFQDNISARGSIASSVRPKDDEVSDRLRIRKSKLPNRLPQINTT